MPGAIGPILGGIIGLIGQNATNHSNQAAASNAQANAQKYSQQSLQQALAGENAWSSANPDPANSWGGAAPPPGGMGLGPVFGGGTAAAAGSMPTPASPGPPGLQQILAQIAAAIAAQGKGAAPGGAPPAAGTPATPTGGAGVGGPGLHSTLAETVGGIGNVTPQNFHVPQRMAAL